MIGLIPSRYKILLLTLFYVTLSGCSIYRMDVQQGNAFTAEMTQHIKKGMHKEEVQHIMGTPALAQGINVNRWDYYYYFKPGNGAKVIERTFTVFFKNNRVVDWK